MSLAKSVLLPIPYAHQLGRKLRRRYRSIVGPLVLREVAKRDPIQIVLGASGVHDPGWAPTDIEYLNIASERDWQTFFLPSTITAMLAEHVWEYLTPSDALEAARLCHKYLKPNGYLRAAVPDGLHPDPSYIRRVTPGAIGADGGEVLYTYHTFKSLFERAGLQVQLLEYFDEKSDFHFLQWRTSEGMIHRSQRFDRRNADGHLHYTSVIIDAYKV